MTQSNVYKKADAHKYEARSLKDGVIRAMTSEDLNRLRRDVSKLETANEVEQLLEEKAKSLAKQVVKKEIEKQKKKQVYTAVDP